jgi:SAM-dependent methyltransferase
MFGRLRSVFFHLLPARRLLSRFRTPYYGITAPLRHLAAAPLIDLPHDETSAINRKSDEYFDKSDQHGYWINKPLSDINHGSQDLWRFGLLLSALMIRPEDRVLDFGCGTGWTSALLGRTGAEITATDISARALDLAESYTAADRSGGRGARVRFQRFDGVRIDAPDGYFDFIVVFDAFHHLPNPVAILEEFCRVLGPHGYVGFAEPGSGHSKTFDSRQEMQHGVLENEIDPEQLRNAARGAGFSELELVVPPVPPNIMMLPMPRARWYLRGVPWIVPHDYIRAAMLASPIGVLRKGPYISTSLHPHGLRAEIRPSVAHVNVREGERFTITTSVVNRAGTVWLRTGRRGAGDVRAGGRILRLPDRSPVHECERTDIPADMAEGDACVLDVRCLAPDEPGEYVVRLEMIDEGIAWFSGGDAPADVRLTVDSKHAAPEPLR